MSTVTITPARPKADPFLLAILAGLGGLLIIAGLAVVLSRQPAPQLPANTPGGTVQRFYTAIQQEDYETAYSLLSAGMVDYPTYTRFVQYNLGQGNRRADQQNTSIRIESEKTRDSVAVVVLAITTYYHDPGPFSGSGQWTSTETFTLRQEDGTWHITDLPYGYIPYHY